MVFQLLFSIIHELGEPVHTLLLQVTLGVLVQDVHVIPFPFGHLSSCDWSNPPRVHLIEGEELSAIVAVLINSFQKFNTSIWTFINHTAMSPLKNMEI